MYIKRKLEDAILRNLNSPEITAVVGPRQCGKTTMVNNLMQGLEDSAVLTFDNQNMLAMFEKNTDAFISSYVKGNKYLFIDEFQYAKNGGKILKYIFDTQKIKIIISGSSVADLTVRAIKYLVGRIFVFNLYPFDFEEFLLARDANLLKLYVEYKGKINLMTQPSKSVKISDIIHKRMLKYYEEFLLFGGYPRVVLEENYEQKKELLNIIYNTYFLREVRDILGLIDDYKLNNLIKGLALQIGNLVEYQDLSRLSGYSFAALKKYLNFLEKTYVCHFVRPFYKNKRTEIVKNPKVYFFDTGLRNVIVNDFRSFNERTDSGALLENGLACQLIKKNWEFNFWRDKKKNELDFVVALGNGKTIAVESKNYLKETSRPATRVFQKNYPEINIYHSYWQIEDKLKNSNFILPVYLY